MFVPVLFFFFHCCGLAGNRPNHTAVGKSFRGFFFFFTHNLKHAQIIQKLHDSNIAHRDLRPENMFIVQKDENGIVLKLGISDMIDD
jgi:serine/threonine protein kinase